MNRTFLKIIRYSLYTLQLLLLYVFQSIPIFNLNFLGVSPILLIPAFITICVFEREFAAVGFGILTGFLMDLSVSNEVGPQMFVFCFIGFIVGFIITYFFRSGVLTVISTSAVAVPFTVVFNFYMKSVFHAFEFTALNLYRYILPCVLYTFLLTILFFLINRVICYFFSFRNAAKGCYR